MNILVDSNILVRLANAGDPQQSLAIDATDKLKKSGHALIIIPQDLYEFWSVATRPLRNNGLGLNVPDVQLEAACFNRFFVFVDDTAAICAEWEKLVSVHSVVGKQAHDARLVAAMIVHGITHLLTFNQADFQRFSGITAMTPAEAMALP